MEMRSAISPDIARLAARRASEAIQAALKKAARAMAQTEELSALQGLALEFWTALVEGSDNVAYRLAHNTLRAAYEPFLDLVAPALEAELRARDAYAAIAHAVSARDEAEAERQARRLSQKGEASLASLAQALDAFAAAKAP
jgi:DNA-binding FadR family transcriptional regulator